MARKLIDTTPGAGDTIKVGGDKINDMTKELFELSDLSLITGGLNRPMIAASFGCSHMTSYFAGTLSQCLMVHHRANLTYDFRQVFSESDKVTVQNPRGDCYATGQTTSQHLIDTQLPKFVSDVAAGKVIDIVFTDMGLYNDAPTTQAGLNTVYARLLTALGIWFANGVKAVVIQGTFGLTPVICTSWAQMMRRLEALSSAQGRVRFFDIAPAIADPATTTGSTWTPRGTSGTFGSVQHDPTHLSSYGQRLAAYRLAPILRDIVPKTLQWGHGFANSLYDPVNFPNGDLLGQGAGMIGTQGLLNQASIPGNLPGTGPGGGDKNTWLVERAGITMSASTTYSTAPDSLGCPQIEAVVSGDATSNGGSSYVRFGYRPIVTNVNNSDATRRWMLGLEVDLIGVSGLTPPFLTVNGAHLLPSSPANEVGQFDGLPDNLTETWRIRTLYPVALTGDSPYIYWTLPFRQKTGVSGTIRARLGFGALQVAA